MALGTFQRRAEFTFSLRGVGGHAVEDVHQDEKQSDEKSHPARNDVRWDHKADPGDHHKQA